MIDPAKVAFWVPPELKNFKRKLFDRIGEGVKAKGGRLLYDDFTQLERLPGDVIPVVGCSPYLRPLITQWRASGRPFIYWDRGYARRVFATSLPIGTDGGFYRWHLNGFQMQQVKGVPDDRWKALATPLAPWAKGGRHIVIAAPSRTYAQFHGIEGWIADTIDALARVTGRQLVIRDKEHCRTRPLQADLEGAHCLVTHGSIAAVESVILGCPVFVHSDSAAALVGRTDLKEIERPVYPDRGPWVNSLAYCQFSEREMVDGTLWRLLQ